MSKKQTLVEKKVHIPVEVAQRLYLLARTQQVSEDELVTRALDIFLGLAHDASIDKGDWTAASERAFSQVWDNEDDAAYDNWRELYGVPAR